MYRLLIVTGKQEVQELFASLQGWDALGFKPPRLRDSVEAALECMRKHHIDAMAIDDAPAFEPLYAYLEENAPNLPIFSIEKNAEAQQRVMREVSSLLSRLHADDSNDLYDEDYRMLQQQERWIRKVLCGLVPTVEEMRKQMRLYRVRERLDVPCVLGRLELPPADDVFLSERWHYGSERLETALRNFFGHTHDHMVLHVAVVSPQEVRVLCYPRNEADGLSENAAYDYIQETVEQIANYLGLELKVTEVCRVSGLAAFAAQDKA